MAEFKEPPKYRNLDCKVNFVSPSVINNSDGFYGIVELWREAYEYWLETGRIQVPRYLDSSYVFDWGTGVYSYPQTNVDARFDVARDRVDCVFSTPGFSHFVDAVVLVIMSSNTDAVFEASGFSEFVDAKAKFNTPAEILVDATVDASGFGKLVDSKFTHSFEDFVDSVFFVSGIQKSVDGQFLCVTHNSVDAEVDIIGVNRSLVDAKTMFQGSDDLSLQIEFDIIRPLTKVTKGPFSLVVNRSDTPEQIALDRSSRKYAKTDSSGSQTTRTVTNSKKYVQFRIVLKNYPDVIVDEKDFAVQFDVVGEITQEISITFDIATVQQILRTQRLKYSFTSGSISGDVVLTVIPVVAGVEQKSSARSLSFRLVGTCGIFVFWKIVAESYNVYRADKTSSGTVLTLLQSDNTTGEFLYD